MNYTIWNDNTSGGMTPLPIVYLHSFRGNGEDVWKACHGLNDCPPMVLVSVNNPGTGLDDELSPWPAEGVWKGQAPYKGQAAEHLRWMMEECVPQVEAEASRFIRDTQGSQANGNSITRTSDANAGGMGKADNALLMPMREAWVRPTMPVRRSARTLRTVPRPVSCRSSPATPSQASSPYGPPGTQGISAGWQVSPARYGIPVLRIS